MLYESWTMSDRGGSPHISLNDLKLHLWHDWLLPWFLVPISWTMHLTSDIVVQWCWYKYRHAILLFYECCMRYVPRLTGVNHPTYHWMNSNYTQDMLRCYTGSCTQEIELWTGVWIWYPTVLWVLYVAWTTLIKGGSSHRSQHDLKLHPRHTQMLPWFSDPITWTMNLTNVSVVKEQWHSYRHAIPLF